MHSHSVDMPCIPYSYEYNLNFDYGMSYFSWVDPVYQEIKFSVSAQYLPFSFFCAIHKYHIYLQNFNENNG